MGRLGRSARLSALVALLGTAGLQAAKADLVETVDIPFFTPGSEAVVLPQFNPALGMLNAALVTETATVSFALEIFNHGAGPFTAMARSDFAFGLGGPPSQPAFLSASGAIPAGTPIYGPDPLLVPLGSLMISFGPDADSFFIGIVLIVIAWFMDMAVDLREENELTI